MSLKEIVNEYIRIVVDLIALFMKEMRKIGTNTDIVQSDSLVEPLLMALLLLKWASKIILYNNNIQ